MVVHVCAMEVVVLVVVVADGVGGGDDKDMLNVFNNVK